MEDTQLFRLAGTSAVKKISCDHVDDQSVIYWEDIEHFFTGVKHVMNGEAFVKLLRDSNRNRIVPHCIKHHPSVILDVVLSSSHGDTFATTGWNRSVTSNPGVNDIVEGLQVTQRPLYTSDNDGISGILSYSQVTEHAQKNAFRSETERELLLSLSAEFQAKVLASPNIHDALVQAIMDDLVDRPNEHLVVLLRRIKDEVARNGKLESRVMGLTSKNNALLSRVVDLAAQNGELASENNQLVLKNKELMNHANKLQEDLDRRKDGMKQLQLQTLGLRALQKNVHSLLTHKYELHEYPIPKLFIVLPEDTSSWNPLDFLSNKLRLYFLCECGEHTKSNNTNIPHHIHLANHEGYEVARPSEFFQQYGSYVLTILQMLRHGISAAGVTIPVLTHLVSPEAMRQVTEVLESLKNDLEPGLDQVIIHIEKVSADEDGVVARSTERMKNNEALEDADLLQLETLLKNKDKDRILGNLYRTVTAEGHVKWVCIDHYRENHHEKEAKEFHDVMEALGGSFNESIGRVEVKLRSNVMAEQFYAALERSRSVYELKIEFDLRWDKTQSDFKRLQDTLSKTCVGVLELDLGDTDGPIDYYDLGGRYDPIIDIIRHPSIQSFTCKGSRIFPQRFSLISRDIGFPNLRHLDVHVTLDQWGNDIPGVTYLIAMSSNLSRLALEPIEYGTRSLRQTVDNLISLPTLRHLEIPLYQWKDDISSVKSLVAKAPNLSSLVARTSGCEKSHLLAFYNAIAENQTYQIIFKDLNFCIPPPPRGQSVVAYRRLQDLMAGRSRDASEQILDGDKLDESTVVALAKTVGGSLSFNMLELKRADKLGDTFIENLSDIVAQSGLRAIEIWMEDDKGRVHILESIQWEHLCKLEVRLKPENLETSVMRALVDGVKKMPGRVGLTDFRLYSDCYKFIDNPLSMPEANLLQSFIASTPLENLLLEVILTLEQVFSLLKLVDESQLQSLTLWTKGFGSIDVEAILHGLQNATKLKTLKLLRAEISDEQVDRMQERGATLSNTW